MSRRDYVVSGTRSILTDSDKALIAAFLIEYGVDDSESRDVLHHGDCRTGVDAYVAELAEGWPLQIKPHRAEWGIHGKKAGPIRNRAMIAAARPNMCFAFPRRGLENRGTRDFVSACFEAQVDVQVFWLFADVKVVKA